MYGGCGPDDLRKLLQLLLDELIYLCGERLWQSFHYKSMSADDFETIFRVAYKLTGLSEADGLVAHRGALRIYL